MSPVLNAVSLSLCVSFLSVHLFFSLFRLFCLLCRCNIDSSVQCMRPACLILAVHESYLQVNCLDRRRNDHIHYRGAGSFSDNHQTIRCFVTGISVNRFENSLLLVCILSHFNPCHTLTPI